MRLFSSNKKLIKSVVKYDIPFSRHIIYYIAKRGKKK